MVNFEINITEALYDYNIGVESYKKQYKKIEKFLRNDKDVVSAYISEYFELDDEDYVDIGFDDIYIHTKKSFSDNVMDEIGYWWELVRTENENIYVIDLNREVVE